MPSKTSCGRLLAGLADRVRRVLAADPGEAEVEQHLLHVGPVGEAVGEAAGRAEAGRRRCRRRVFRAAVVRRMFSRMTSAAVLPSISQGARWKRNWMSSGSRRLDVDVVVGVVADRVAGLDDLLEPVDVLLLEHAADGEEVEHAAARLDAPARLDGVLLGLVVEVALLVVPVGRAPRSGSCGSSPGRA